MKRILLSALFLSLVLFGFSQIQGGFYSFYDNYGYSHIYFKGTNLTQYNYDITITYLNTITGEKKVKYCKPLYSNNNFTIGENDGWWWQPGEYLIITYSNGKSYYWRYGDAYNTINGREYKSYNPSFGGSKKSDRLISEAESEEKWGNDCLYKAKLQLDLNNISGYNSWKSAADDHFKKAKRLRSDAAIERKYGN